MLTEIKSLSLVSSLFFFLQLERFRRVLFPWELHAVLRDSLTMTACACLVLYSHYRTPFISSVQIADYKMLTPRHEPILQQSWPETQPLTCYPIKIQKVARTKCQVCYQQAQRPNKIRPLWSLPVKASASNACEYVCVFVCVCARGHVCVCVCVRACACSCSLNLQRTGRW